MLFLKFLNNEINILKTIETMEGNLTRIENSVGVLHGSNNFLVWWFSGGRDPQTAAMTVVPSSTFVPVIRINS